MGETRRCGGEGVCVERDRAVPSVYDRADGDRGREMGAWHTLRRGRDGRALDLRLFDDGVLRGCDAVWVRAGLVELPVRGVLRGGRAGDVLEGAGVKVSEKGVQQVFTDICYLYDRRWYHTHDSRRSASGFPDLVVSTPWGPVFAEVKTATGRIAPAQREWLTDLARCGIVVVLRPGCEDWWVHLMADGKTDIPRLCWEHRFPFGRVE